MTFRVGQKVVCVDDDFVSRNQGQKLPPNLPKLNEVYVIRSFQEWNGRTFMRLVEVVNPISGFFKFETAFNPDRFRPVVERKTDIGFAHEILREVTGKDRVRA